MKKKMIGIVAAMLLSAVLGGCATVSTASAEDLAKESTKDTDYSAQEISVFEPEQKAPDKATDQSIVDEIEAGSENNAEKFSEREENHEESTKESTDFVNNATSVSDENLLRFMQEIAPEMGFTVRIVDHSELTLKDLEERQNSYVLVERMDCLVEDSEGNGRILNVEQDDNANYIKFDSKDFSAGDLVEVYCTYANSEYTDDVESRADFLVGTMKECESVYGGNAK